MPGSPAPLAGRRTGRSGSLRATVLSLVLVPCLGLALGWGCACALLIDAGHRVMPVLGTLGVAAVLAGSLARARRVAAGLTSRVDGLRDLARGIAETELPAAVARIRTGEPLPAAPDDGPGGHGSDNSGPHNEGPARGDGLQQAAEALGTLRRTALAVVLQQAREREGTRKVFLDVARRTQVLIHRQINMLDALEREHAEPELLKELFAVDHLATRMRRAAENLVILGGALPAHRWRRAVPMVNVLRSAVSDTECYPRVAVHGVPRISLGGRAVADVIHLTAELIENGAAFSPPHTQVLVSAQDVPKGLAVEVEDRGPGMSAEEYERLNVHLADPSAPVAAAAGDELRLGLSVIARLAARHGIRVTLRPSPYGGTRAVVLIPAGLLEQPESPAGIPGLPFGARIAGPPPPAPTPNVLTGGPARAEEDGPAVGSPIPGLPGAVVAAFTFPRPTAEPFDPLDDSLEDTLAATFTARRAARIGDGDGKPTDDSAGGDDGNDRATLGGGNGNWAASGPTLAELLRFEPRPSPGPPPATGGSLGTVRPLRRRTDPTAAPAGPDDAPTPDTAADPATEDSSDPPR